MPTPSPRATMPSCAGSPARTSRRWCREPTWGKTSRTFCSGLHVIFWIASCFPWAASRSPRSASWPARRDCALPISPTARKSALSPTTITPASSERYRGAEDTSGELVDTAGNVLGRHDGYHHFTIGQRRGLGVAFGSPRFVVAIDPQSKRVVIGTREDLARTVLEADGLNWMVPDVPRQFSCRAKIRYRHDAAAANVARDGGPDSGGVC